MKYLNIVLGVLCALAMCIVLFVHGYFNYEDTRYDRSALININNGWKYICEDDVEDDVSLPIEKNVSANSVVTISKMLTGDFKTPKTIIFSSFHQNVKVFLGEREIYSYGYLYNDYDISKTKGSVQNYIKIPSNSEGKELSIIISSQYSHFAGSISELVVGDAEAVLSHNYFSKIPALLMAFLLVIAAIVCYCFYFIAKRQKFSEYKIFPLMGTFSLLVVVWALAQFNVYNTIFGDAQMSYYIEYFSLLLLPIPCNGYVYNTCKSNRRVQIKFIIVLYFINFFINLLMQFNKVFDMVSLLDIYFAIYLVNLVVILCVLFYEVKYVKNSMAKMFQIPLPLMLFTGVAAIISEKNKDYELAAYIILSSVLILIFFFVFKLVSGYFKVLSEKKETDYMLKIADIDMMTKAPNRNAYEKELKSYDEDVEKISGTIVLLFDLNFLKRINDNFGHEFGDMAISTCYECMMKIFSKKGKCFRIGGDEFICISHEEHLKKEILAFQSVVKAKAKEFVFPFSVAVGCARFNSNVDSSIHDVIKRSDEMMYKNKVELKKKIDKLK